jgi:hypothetical protein
VLADLVPHAVANDRRDDDQKEQPRQGENTRGRQDSPENDGGLAREHEPHEDRGLGKDERTNNQVGHRRLHTEKVIDQVVHFVPVLWGLRLVTPLPDPPLVSSGRKGVCVRPVTRAVSGRASSAQPSSTTKAPSASPATTSCG